MRPPPPPDFQQLTFQRGRIGGARFGLQSVVYSLALPGRPLEVWQTGLDGSDPRSVGFANADLLGVLIGMLPQSEELALSLERHYVGGERFIGTLARARAGEPPREVLSDVEDADWNPSSQQFAVARSSGVGGDSRLEYPIGHTIHSTRGSIHSVRISRDGQRVAFVEDRGGAGVGGRIVVASRDKIDIISDYWASARGIAWSPRGDEVWFTAGERNATQKLWGVDLKKHLRLVLEVPGSLTIWDANPDGRVLLTRDDKRMFVMGVPPGATSER